MNISARPFKPKCLEGRAFAYKQRDTQNLKSCSSVLAQNAGSFSDSM